MAYTKRAASAAETARKYSDIINMERPVSRHPRMDLVNRAKIFTPYDALRGFDEAIDAVRDTPFEEYETDDTEPC